MHPVNTVVCSTVFHILHLLLWSMYFLPSNFKLGSQ